MPLPSFPSYRYHATLKPCLVQSPEESDALGPEWADSPAAWLTPTTPIATADPAPVAADPASTDPTMSDGDRAASLYNAKGHEVVGMVRMMTDRDKLQAVREMEERNPRVTGGRPKVIGAIEARLAELAVTVTA